VETPAPYQRSFLNKSADVVPLVKCGRIVPKRDIASCRGTAVGFSDGTSADVDCIFTCSGYRMTFPFFDESATPGEDPRNWFKYIFYQDDPSVAFVGFVRPIFGSIPGIAELQSRYAAKVFSGACRLPSRAGEGPRSTGTPGSGITIFATPPSGSPALWTISSIPTSLPD
jgi:hypothetical protein